MDDSKKSEPINIPNNRRQQGYIPVGNPKEYQRMYNQYYINLRWRDYIHAQFKAESEQISTETFIKRRNEIDYLLFKRPHFQCIGIEELRKRQYKLQKLLLHEDENSKDTNNDHSLLLK